MSCEGHNPENIKLKAPKRNRFFYGKMLDEFHLRMETNYHNNKRWLLNRLSLGHGVLCGLKVTPSQDGNQLFVSSGMAIDAWGREIIVPEPFCIDPWQDPDPACGIVETLDRTRPIYLCLVYRECLTDPVPVLVTDCESQDQTQCGSIVEGYKWMLTNTEPPESDLWPNKPSEALCTALKAENAIARLKALCLVFAGEQCQPSDTPPCVRLAKIELDSSTQTIKEPIDDCSVRPFAVSNEKLFEMILCLAGREISNLELPKILDVGWNHDSLYFYYGNPENENNRFFWQLFYQNSNEGMRMLTPEELLERIKSKQNVPLFTIYFDKTLNGIDEQTFNVIFRMPALLVRNVQGSPVAEPLGFYLNLEVYGYLIHVINTASSKAKTPHTEEEFEYAVSFIPDLPFLVTLLPLFLVLRRVLDPRYKGLVLPKFLFRLKGDFIWSKDAQGTFSKDLVLDADNLGGNVGFHDNTEPDTKYPSGNSTRGGDFESWLSILMSYTEGESLDLPFINLTHSFSSSFKLTPEEIPVNINLASMDQLNALGFTEAQSKVILNARTKGWFTNKQDFIERSKLKPDELAKIQKNFIVF